MCFFFFFFFQAEDGIRDIGVTGVQTCALPIFGGRRFVELRDETCYALTEYGGRQAVQSGPPRPGDGGEKGCDQLWVVAPQEPEHTELVSVQIAVHGARPTAS